MPILTLQRRLRELGRIRAGDKTDKNAPRKLTAYRFTSASETVIRDVSNTYGGNIQPWDSPNGPQWQVYTTADTLPVRIPGGQSISQWYEQWSAGGCTVRCDGVTDVLTDRPCHCDPDPTLRECDPTTRLNVILPELSDIGQWRLETKSWYGATELAAIADLLAMTDAQFIPARIRLEQRSVKRPGKPVNRFAVTVIESDARMGDVLKALGVAAGFEQLDAPPARTAITAGDVEAPDLGEAWIELTQLLKDDPDPEATMPILERSLRRLYELMEQVGLWHGTDAGDPLHLALKKHHDVAHVGDLRKDGLVSFVGLSWTAARDAVGRADG